MLNISYRKKYEGEIETLRFNKPPYHGYCTDVNGITWDVRCYTGGTKPYINARRVDTSNYYSTSVDADSYGMHTWKPYYFEYDRCILQ
jgi:hypothetical protein